MKSMKTPLLPWLTTTICLFAAMPQEASAQAPLQWTDPAAALAEDPDFSIQGEYAGVGSGVQVVALGDGQFTAFVFDGGLPGAGWSPGMGRDSLQGARGDGVVALTDEAGKVTATIRDKKLILVGADGKKELERIERASPTLGAEPPEGAVVLFDDASADDADGLLITTGKMSEQRFSDYTLHLEFRTPYMPTARDQRRGNSGVYHSGRWETQILDSFGLEAGAGDCGGIYSIAPPRLNMCLPPLAWQTYDVEFTAAKFDAEGNRTAWPRITVKLNGVTIHEDLELAKNSTPAAPVKAPLDGPAGPIYLQYHSNPVRFRNIWVVPGG